MKTFKKLWYIFLLSVLLAGCSSHQKLKQAISITSESGSFALIYPHIEAGDSIVAGAIKDSVFIYGNVSDINCRLSVNGHFVDFHSDGGWLAWIAIDSVFSSENDSLFGKGMVAPVTISYFAPSNDTVTASRTFYFFEAASTWDGHHAQVRKMDAKLTVTSNNAKIRCGWPGTYDTFPFEGTEIICDGVINTGRKFYRLPLGNGETGWIEDEFVEVDTSSKTISQPVIYSITSEVHGRKTKIKIPIRKKVVFKIKQESQDQIDLYLYNVMSWTDLIIQPFESKVVKEVRWSQLDSLTYKVTAFMNPGWFWGWDAEFEDGIFFWNIHQAPEIKGNGLKDLVIAVDPGHGGWNKSAIGPTGFTEKEANLELSLVLQKFLKKAGADVRMTRETDVYIPLLDRMNFVKEEDADLSLSIHYNGLPQGVNPFERHGSSIHYNHFHSYELSAKLYQSILNKIVWKGNGLRYQDLAMARVKYCPAVLIETGFLLHAEEEAQARDPKFQKMIAKAIIDGIKDYLKEIREMQRAG